MTLNRHRNSRYEFTWSATVEPVASQRVLTITISGDFDAAADVDLSSIANSHSQIDAVRVDLTGTTVLDSSALRRMIQLRSSLDATTVPLETVVASFHRRVLEVAGLAEHLGCRRTAVTEN